MLRRLIKEGTLISRVYWLLAMAWSMHAASCNCISIRGCSVPGNAATTHLLGHNALESQVAAHALDQLNLVLGAKLRNGRLEDGAEVDLVHGNKCVVVHVCKEAHDELAIHAIRHATVARDRVAKVLDLEAALQARCEKPAEGGNQGSKRGQDERMKLHGRNGKGNGSVVRQEEELRQLIQAGQEDGVRVALEAGKDVGTKVL